MPTWVYHFTHVDHLPTIVRHGLVADAEAQRDGRIVHEVGDRGVKGRRRRRPVPVGSRTVADHVPFYLAPRSPMMYKIHRGGVPQYTGSIHELVYLVTTVELLQEAGASLLLSDRNAAKAVAAFSAEPADWDDLVDWPLMGAERWDSTAEDPERMERRMAECLVHAAVPWSVVGWVAASTQQRADAVREVLDAVGSSARAIVRPRWYF